MLQRLELGFVHGRLPISDLLEARVFEIGAAVERSEDERVDGVDSLEGLLETSGAGFLQFVDAVFVRERE